MNLIDRYVMLTFLRVLMWALIAFVSIFILVDLFDHIDNFIDDNAGAGVIVRYYLFLVPQIVDLILPVSMLLAALFTLGIFSKNREYTAILSAGQSLARMTRSILLLAALVAIGSGAWREFVVAPANRLHSDVQRYEIEGEERDRLQSRRNLTHIGQDGRVYVASRFRPRPPTLDSVTIQTFSDSTLVRRIDAQRAVWEEGRWQLRDGAVRDFRQGNEQVTPFRERWLEPPIEPPEDFARRQVNPDDMTWRELREFATYVQRSGGDPTPYRAEMAHKISFPVINFLIVVLGISLGASRRKNTLWSGFGLTLGLAFGYYLFMNFGLELGRSGAVPIYVSAWAGNAVYAVAGLLLFVRANR